jgi:predicted dehydrogenase
MEKLKIGIIGTGYLGKLHAKLLKTHENADFIGIYDVNKNAAETVANEFGLTAFDNDDELIDKCEALIIVTPTSTHYEIAKKILSKEKHVFIEKPITAEIWQAEELVELAKQKNVKIQVGHIERFNSALLALEKYKLEPMFIQTDRLAQFNPRGTDVAVVLDLMIHDIDIILSLIKSKVKQINASGVAVVSDTLDIANARIEFENGAVANVTASRISLKKMRKMRMFQRDGYYSLDFTNGIAEVYRLLNPTDEKPENLFALGEIGDNNHKKTVVYEKPQIKEVNAMQYEQQLFISSVLEDKRPVVNGEDGLRALRVADMIINQIEETNKNIL